MAQNLPSITKVTVDNYNTQAAFIADCVRYSFSSTFKYTALPVSFSANDFFNWLQADELYVLNRNHKAIGIVVLHETSLSEESFVNFTTFLHPRVCKMAAISLLRGALCIASIYAVINKASSISTYLYHSLMTSTVRQLFPMTRAVKVTESSHFCAVGLTDYTLERLTAQLRSLFIDEELEEYLALF